jgi:hypothetical protein
MGDGRVKEYSSMFTGIEISREGVGIHRTAGWTERN